MGNRGLSTGDVGTARCCSSAPPCGFAIETPLRRAGPAGQGAAGTSALMGGSSSMTPVPPATAARGRTHSDPTALGIPAVPLIAASGRSQQGEQTQHIPAISTAQSLGCRDVPTAAPKGRPAAGDAALRPPAVPAAQSMDLLHSLEVLGGGTRGEQLRSKAGWLWAQAGCWGGATQPNAVHRSPQPRAGGDLMLFWNRRRLLGRRHLLLVWAEQSRLHFSFTLPAPVA